MDAFASFFDMDAPFGVPAPSEVTATTNNNNNNATMGAPAVTDTGFFGFDGSWGVEGEGETTATTGTATLQAATPSGASANAPGILTAASQPQPPSLAAQVAPSFMLDMDMMASMWAATEEGDGNSGAALGHPPPAVATPASAAVDATPSLSSGVPQETPRAGPPTLPAPVPVGISPPDGTTDAAAGHPTQQPAPPPPLTAEALAASARAASRTQVQRPPTGAMLPPSPRAVFSGRPSDATRDSDKAATLQGFPQAAFGAVGPGRFSGPAALPRELFPHSHHVAGQRESDGGSVGLGATPLHQGASIAALFAVGGGGSGSGNLAGGGGGPPVAASTASVPTLFGPPSIDIQAIDEAIATLNACHSEALAAAAASEGTSLDDDSVGEEEDMTDEEFDATVAEVMRVAEETTDAISEETARTSASLVALLELLLSPVPELGEALGTPDRPLPHLLPHIRAILQDQASELA